MSTLLKYAGNKRKIMSEINPYLGDWVGVKRYVEPFAGALGSALNAAVPSHVDVHLSDVNEDIIELYEEVARDPQALQDAANALATDEASYYTIRALDRDPLWPSNHTRLQRAARTRPVPRRGYRNVLRCLTTGNDESDPACLSHAVPAS